LGGGEVQSGDLEIGFRRKPAILRAFHGLGSSHRRKKGVRGTNRGCTPAKGDVEGLLLKVVKTENSLWGGV